jgi:predicted ATPase
LGRLPPAVEEVHAPVVECLCLGALSEWHLGGVDSSQTTMAEASSLATALKDNHALAMALSLAAFLGHFRRNPVEVERLASELIELCTRQNFALWLAAGEVLRAWARSVSSRAADGLACMEEGMRALRATGLILNMPYALAVRAEALHVASRTTEALAVIKEAETLAKRVEEHWWSAELQRLRGVFLMALGADEAQVEASFDEAIRTAKRQKSISLMKRAEASHAEYRGQKRSVKMG